MPPPKILFLTAEATPFAKTGGLADVCGSLPIALHSLGHDVRIIMPAYRSIEAAQATGKWNVSSLPLHLTIPTDAGWLPAGAFYAPLPSAPEIPVHFIAERKLFDRPEIYGYDDDPYRFAFFSKAAIQLLSAMDWYPDIIHAHDWHAAPAILWLATAGQADLRLSRIPTIFTIHNLAHQGRSSRNVLRYMGLNVEPLYEESVHEVNFMAQGIYHATLINTVSPSYAREILTPEGGAGLDGLLRHRHYDVHGILNGIDDGIWNPQKDPHLTQPFDSSSLDARKENKYALQSRLGLPIGDVPLLAMISRLDRQKGLDILGHALHLLLNGVAGEAQFVLLGTGAKEYEDMLLHLAGYHSRKMRAILAYAPDLAPLIYAGSDMFLMPSLFEPCGLGQMIAMRYGSVPVVRETGGLADTVHDGVTGFTFYEYHSADLWNAMQRALYIYHTDPQSWQKIQTNGMTADYSWTNSAFGYRQLYEWALARFR